MAGELKPNTGASICARNSPWASKRRRTVAASPRSSDCRRESSGDIGGIRGYWLLVGATNLLEQGADNPENRLEHALGGAAGSFQCRAAEVRDTHSAVDDETGGPEHRVQQHVATDGERVAGSRRLALGDRVDAQLPDGAQLPVVEPHAVAALAQVEHEPVPDHTPHRPVARRTIDLVRVAARRALLSIAVERRLALVTGRTRRVGSRGDLRPQRGGRPHRKLLHLAALEPDTATT